MTIPSAGPTGAGAKALFISPYLISYLISSITATRFLSSLRLDGPTAEVLLALIDGDGPAVSDTSRQMAAI